MIMRGDGLTNPPVASLRSKQATVDPSNCAIQYEMLLSSVMLPPIKAPKVTAGLTWPPEMFAPIETATKSAYACDIAAAISPDAVCGPLFVSLSAIKNLRHFIVFERCLMANSFSSIDDPGLLLNESHKFSIHLNPLPYNVNIERVNPIIDNENLLKAMPEPSPAKTKMSVEKNSAAAALSASGWLASPGVPIAIL